MTTIMKKLTMVLYTCVAMATDVRASETVKWFDEDAETVSMAIESAGVTQDGVWSGLGGQVEIADSKVVIDADDESAVAYRPNAALTDTNATIVLADIVFDAARKTLPTLGENAQAAVAITTNGAGACVFAVADGGKWAVTTTAADPGTSYAVKVDFAYAGGGNAASYAVSNETGWVSLKADAVNLKSEKITAVEFAGSGSFAALIGTYPLGVVAVTPDDPYVCDTAEEASNVLKRAKFTSSVEVARRLGGEGSRNLDDYRQMFTLDVVPTSDGKWAVAAFLNPVDWTKVVESAKAATLQIPVAELAARKYGSPLENVPLTNCVPGFYYSLYDGASVTNLKVNVNPLDCNILCGPGTTVVLPVVPQPAPASGFFSIGVLDVPSVIPGETETSTNLHAYPPRGKGDKSDIL